MKTSDLIKQAEELLRKCSKGPFESQDYEVITKSLDDSGCPDCDQNNLIADFLGNDHQAADDADLLVFARNHMQELIDRLKETREELSNILGWQSLAPADVIESARKALEENT